MRPASLQPVHGAHSHLGSSTTRACIAVPYDLASIEPTNIVPDALLPPFPVVEEESASHFRGIHGNLVRLDRIPLGDG